MIEVLEKSWNFQSSIGNTVRDYFKDTVTPHFFNVAIRCIVLIKTAFLSYCFKKIPLSRRIGYVMGSSLSGSVRDVCMLQQSDWMYY